MKQYYLHSIQISGLKLTFVSHVLDGSDCRENSNAVCAHCTKQYLVNQTNLPSVFALEGGMLLSTMIERRKVTRLPIYWLLYLISLCLLFKTGGVISYIILNTLSELYMTYINVCRWRLHVVTDKMEESQLFDLVTNFGPTWKMPPSTCKPESATATSCFKIHTITSG